MEIIKKRLVNLIKDKKEISGLEDSIVLNVLNDYLKKSRIDISSLREKEIKFIVKEIRSELRMFTGRFQRSSKSREYLINSENFDALLNTHSSTKERAEFYNELKEEIYSSNPKSILDLGCGLNPIAIAKKGVYYFASDIRADELEIIKNFFLKKGINGKTFVYNLKDFNGNLPKADVCLILKVLDIIENKGHKLAEKIISNIECNKIIVSFPTKTLSGRAMNHPQRGWIERMLKRRDYNFRTLISKNEIFYIISKSR